MAQIVYNAAKCLKCGDEIASYHRHDFKMCSCGAIGVDGGHDYLRRIGEPSDREDRSVYSDSHIGHIREIMKWGRNYDENKNRLPTTEWIKIKEINDDHLDAIISYPSVSDVWKVIFLREKQYRNLDMEGL